MLLYDTEIKVLNQAAIAIYKQYKDDIEKLTPTGVLLMSAVLSALPDHYDDIVFELKRYDIELAREFEAKILKFKKIANDTIKKEGRQLCLL